MPLRFFAILSALVVCGAWPLRAEVLLIVNESDPSAVTVTSTGLDSSAMASYSFNDGFDLEGFFTNDEGNSQTLDGPTLATTLTTANISTGVYNAIIGDNESTFLGANLDANIFEYGTDTPEETFTKSAPAFNDLGTVTFDLKNIELQGHDGTLVAGFSASGVTAIGTYDVIVPEPGTWALVLGGLGLLAGLQRRRSLT